MIKADFLQNLQCFQMFVIKQSKYRPFEDVVRVTPEPEHLPTSFIPENDAFMIILIWYSKSKINNQFIVLEKNKIP